MPKIEIKGIHKSDTVVKNTDASQGYSAPWKGEVHHVNKKGDVLKEGVPLTFGLIGNQNCGKTTLRTLLFKSACREFSRRCRQKDGIIRQHPEATVTDLPGIYSLHTQMKR